MNWKCSMKVLFCLAFVSVVCFFATSCSKPVKPIRIGINAWPGYEFLYLAQEKGFFEAEGVLVDIVEFNSLADGRRSYERGQIDGLGCTLVEYLQILDRSNRSPEIRIVADYSNGADVVLATDKVKAIEALKGMSIGLELDSLGAYILARVLQRADLSLSDVILKPMDQISIEHALCAGEIDSAITYPPFATNLMKNCGVKQIFSSADIPNEIVDVVVFEKHLYNSREASLEAINRAFFAAQDWAFENPKEAFSIMGEREGVSAVDFEISLNEGLHIVRREEQADFLRPGGFLEKALKACEKILIETNQISNPQGSIGDV